MQVMEQPHRTKSPQRRAFFVPVRGALSALGAVTGLAVFWVTEPKRDPLAPHVSVREEQGCLNLSRGLIEGGIEEEEPRRQMIQQEGRIV